MPTRQAGRLGRSKNLGWLDVCIGIILPMLYGDSNEPKRSFNCSGVIEQCKCMVMLLRDFPYSTLVLVCNMMTPVGTKIGHSFRHDGLADGGWMWIVVQ